MQIATNDAQSEVEAAATIEKLNEKIQLAEKLKISEEQIVESRAALEQLKSKVDQVSAGTDV